MYRRSRLLALSAIALLIACLAGPDADARNPYKRAFFDAYPQADGSVLSWTSVLGAGGISASALIRGLENLWSISVSMGIVSLIPLAGILYTRKAETLHYLYLMILTAVGVVVVTAEGSAEPGLLLKLNNATTLGTKILKHYLAYPETWDAAAFEAWRIRADRLFEKVGA